MALHPSAICLKARQPLAAPDFPFLPVLTPA
jgi:hypothetical protein